MRYDDLLRQRRIHRENISEKEVRQAMELAERDLRTARKMMTDELDWAFAVGYNAVLQASRAYMSSEGYRPASFEAHKNTLAFMSAALGREHAALVSFFDRMRVKRHHAVYDQVGLISQREARELLTKAENFLGLIRRRLHAQDPPSPEN